MIEIIKENKVEEAIKYAQTQIAPKCNTSLVKDEKTSDVDRLRAEKFQRDLEQTMMLLIFD